MYPQKSPTPHEKLLAIQRVSNPSTENQRISTPAHTLVVHTAKYVRSEMLIQIKLEGVYGVENPPPRSFLGGISALHISAKEPYIYSCALGRYIRKRALYISAKEPYIYSCALGRYIRKRALYISAKEPYIYSCALGRYIRKRSHWVFATQERKEKKRAVYIYSCVLHLL